MNSVVRERSISIDHLDRQMSALDTAHAIDDIGIPGCRLHALKGKLKGVGPSLLMGIGDSHLSLRTVL